MLATNINDSSVKIHSARIEPSSYYTARIALGPRMKFRNYGSGKWKRGEETDDGNVKWEHEAAIHETEPLSGEVLQGLIEKHNRWYQANQRSEIVKGTDNQSNPLRPMLSNVQDKKQPLYAGQINRMLLVLSYEKTDDRPVERGRGGRIDSAKLVQDTAMATAAALAEVLKPMVEAVTKLANKK